MVPVPCCGVPLGAFKLPVEGCDTGIGPGVFSVPPLPRPPLTSVVDEVGVGALEPEGERDSPVVVE